MDLSGKTFCIFGLKKSGKSTFANYILNQFGELAIYYDTLYEAPEDAIFDVYQPKNRYSVAELELFIKAIIPVNINELPKYRMLIIDETNRFCPPKPAPLPPAVADLNDQCRHYLMSAGYIARRPSQLNQDLTELADYLFIFRLTGKNDIKYLNDTVTGLGDAVLQLQEYEFITVNPDRSFSICNPIQPDKKWLQRAKSLTNR